jgi:hypothetical protein
MRVSARSLKEGRIPERPLIEANFSPKRGKSYTQDPYGGGGPGPGAGGVFWLIVIIVAFYRYAPTRGSALSGNNLQ